MLWKTYLELYAMALLAAVLTAFYLILVSPEFTPSQMLCDNPPCPLCDDPGFYTYYTHYFTMPWIANYFDRYNFNTVLLFCLLVCLVRLRRHISRGEGGRMVSKGVGDGGGLGSSIEMDVFDKEIFFTICMENLKKTDLRTDAGRGG